jgi:hypothetical protein
MAATLKKLLGEAGAGIDDSVGIDRLYDVIKELATVQNDIVAQFNQLKADFDASSTPTSATDVTAGVTIE